MNQFYQKNNGWISTNDIKPTASDGLVLIVKTNGDILIGRYCKDVIEYFANAHGEWIASPQEITHWQHLPQPPKE